jgi:hypothetical protein
VFLKKKFDLVLTVWGGLYTDMFLKVCLPSLLAPGNLPAFGADAECRFKIYTRSSDETVMRQDKTFAKLASLMPVDFIIIDKELETQNSWFIMTTCQNATIRDVRAKSAYLIFIIPDLVYSDGSFRLLIDLVEKGYKGILVFQLGAIRDAFVETYLSQYYDPVERRAAIPPQKLIELWRKHQHPTSNFFLWDSRHYPNDLTSLFGWKAEDGTFIVRSTQFTPLLLYPETDYLLPTDLTVDSVLAKNMVKDPSTVYIIRDSREAVQVEMRPMTEGYVVPFDRPNVPMIARHLNWFRRHGNGNTDYLEEEVWFYSNEHAATKKISSDHSSAIYRTIKDMSEFSSLDQFTAKVKKYFESCINGRPIVILGKGYIADITSAFLRNMGFECRFTQKVNDLDGNEFVFLAKTTSEMELIFTHLEIRGLRYEQDFQITPLAYRHFRKLVHSSHSWQRYYYDYYLPARKNGIKWTMQVLWRKFVKLKIKSLC